MGCDIHPHFEIKINGRWEHYSVVQIDRNYELFGYIAGVRNKEVKPVVEPKGLPTNLTVVTALDLKEWEGDAHNHTWLSVEELGLIPDKCFMNKFGLVLRSNTFGYLFGGDWHNFKQYGEDYPKEVEDVRFICWFDN